jgi:homoserine kinase
MTNQQLCKEELAKMAANIEGHPDNTTPAIMGGLVVSVLEEDKLFYVKLDIPSNYKFAVFIPDFTLSTLKARMVLPERINFKDGVFNVGRSSLLIASLLEGKSENLACAFKDVFHQPYRKKLIPNIERIFEQSMRNGAKGCYISGAGPSLIALIDTGNDGFHEKMSVYLKTLKTYWELKVLELDRKGVETFVN